MWNQNESKKLVERLYRQYYPEGIDYTADILREAYNISLICSRLVRGQSVADIGGGWGVFATACKLSGFDATTIDDRLDIGFLNNSDPRHKMPREAAVNVISCDPLKDGFPFQAETLDAVTSFDSMEHWHQSPKKLFQQAIIALRTGGWFILGVPNAANLKKRVEAVAGLTEWSSLSDWYEEPIFRGHVREPTVRDLKYIAKDIGLAEVQVIGRNFAGYTPSMRSITRAIDGLLQAFPGLCSDIYLIGQKP